MEEQGRGEWLQEMRTFQSTLATRKVRNQEEDVNGLKRAQRDRTPKQGASTSTVTVTYGTTIESKHTIAATINLLSVPKKNAQRLAALDLAGTCVRRTAAVRRTAIRRTGNSAHNLR